MINMPFDASKGNESGCDATVLLAATFSCSLIEYQTRDPRKFVSLKKGPVPGPTKRSIRICLCECRQIFYS